MLPPMKRQGYGAGHAGAIVAAASGMGILVPPCLTMVVYGSITNTSIATLFAAGFVPAFVMTAALMVHLRIDAKRLGLKLDPRVGWRERMKAFVDASWALLLPIIIFGGILGGIFTPTEAAVIAVVYAIIIGMFVYREITLRFLLQSFVRTGITSGVVMLLIAGANIFSWLMTVSGVPDAIASGIQSVGGGKTAFLVMSIFVFLPLFALLDGLPGMLMILPVFIPIAEKLGVNLIHYGIVMTSVMGIALFLPPVGVGLYIILGLSGATVGETSRHLLPYLVTMTVVTLLIAFVPWLVYVVPYTFGLYTPT
jgi:C4-dicarboxylate transporter DctM subunit